MNKLRGSLFFRVVCQTELNWNSFFRSLCKVRPERSLKVFLDSSLEKVNRLLDAAGEDIKTEENLDDELMFNLLIILEVCEISYFTSLIA